MKTRKLMAVLVMVAMIVTALPVVALADGSSGNSNANYSATQTRVGVDKTSVRVKKDVTFTVLFREGGKLVTSETVGFYLKSSRDAEEIKAAEGYEWEPDGQQEWHKPQLVIASLDDGKFEFTVTSQEPGDVEITLYKYAKDFDDEDLVIDKKKITFTKAKDKADYVELKVNKAEGGDAGEYSAQAGEEFELEATVYDDEDSMLPLDDTTVAFYEARTEKGTYKKIGEETTDFLGVATLKVTKDSGGDYWYQVRVGGKKIGNAVKVEVSGGSYYSIEADTSDSAIPLDEPKKVKFIIRDRYGNKANANVVFKLTKPSDSDTVLFCDDADAEDGAIEVEKEENVEFTPDLAGEYVVKATIKGTGLSAKVTFTAGEFGDIASINLKFDGKKKALRAGLDEGDSLKLVVEAVNEDGLKYNLDSDIRYTSNKPLLAVFPSYDEGELKATKKDDRSGIVTVTAIHTETGLTDTLEVPVSGAPVGIEVVEDEVSGKEAEVKMQLVDANGLAAFEVEEEDEAVDVDFSVIATDVDVFESKKFSKNDGIGSFKAEVEEYGEYKFTVVAENGLSASFTVEFVEADAEKVVEGAEKVTLFIGNDFANVDGAMKDLDAPAFIEDGRTYVPFRFLGEAFGAEVDWDPKEGLVETVTLLRDDVEVVIGIGDEFATVTADGEVEVVSFEGLGAAKIVDGRTYLPFRAVADLFDAEVDFGTDEDGYVTWVSFEQ